MGLTIHYSARMKNMGLLPELIHEVGDICWLLPMLMNGEVTVK
jgi:hypothetical protein